MVRLIKKVSKGTRFNQIYLQKNEAGFGPGETVVISPITDIIDQELPIFEYNIKLSSLKKEIVKKIFKIIDDLGSYGNILITGSFLDEGFNFEDMDIVIIDPKINKEKVENSIKEMGILPHLILIDSKSFDRGIKKEPLFRLMVDRFVSIKRTIFREEKDINYRLLDANLFHSKNLIDAYEILSIKERKKLLRDFISIKLFAEDKEVTLNNVKKEADNLFGKDVIKELFYYGNNEAKTKFISKFKKEFNVLQNKVMGNASKQA